MSELLLPAPVSRDLIEEARRAVPEEACGMLVGRRKADRIRVTRMVRCENIAPREDRRTRFEIDPRRVIHEEKAVRDSVEEVVGFYHSHPEGDSVPSKVDRGYMALWPDAVWVIVSPEADARGAGVRAWSLASASEEGPRELSVVHGLDPRGPRLTGTTVRGKKREGKS